MQKQDETMLSALAMPPEMLSEQHYYLSLFHHTLELFGNWQHSKTGQNIPIKALNDGTILYAEVYHREKDNMVMRIKFNENNDHRGKEGNVLMRLEIDRNTKEARPLYFRKWSGFQINFESNPSYTNLITGVCADVTTNRILYNMVLELKKLCVKYGYAHPDILSA